MDKIAIIGMGCLFPNYSDKEKFWNTIMNGGHFLREDEFMGKALEIGGIDFSGTGFFSNYYSTEELEELESYGELYKWCAFVTDEALSDAGYTNDAKKLERTGLILGSVGQTTRDQVDFLGPFITKNLEKEVNQMVGGDQFKYKFTSQIEDIRPESMLADTEPIQYLARKRGIGGPVISFNAACASPLYALRMAMYYLNTGEVDTVIAGSQCYNETIGGIQGLFSKFGILCDIGESMPLDKGSKGLIPGSGAGVFVIKKLTDAERDGDNILAVIESLGWSNDGGTSSGIMTPSVIGQVKAFESAYPEGVSRDIDYIECHATGTVAGDGTEIESIEQFFGFDYRNGEDMVAGRPMLGGLKGSTGHFFTATACASIAKVIMAMKHEVIPATIRINDPLCDGIIRENTPWKAGKKLRRAGINAFGFGGINAHLVLSEYRLGTKNLKAMPEKKIDYSKTELAITGMGLKIGSFESVEDFLQGLINEETAFVEPDENRFRGHDKSKRYMREHGFEELPKGSYINSFRFDAMRFKMPVIGNPFFLRRDMLLLETAAEALDSVGIKKGAAPRTAVIAHSAPDFSDPIFMATCEIDESFRSSLKKSYPELTQSQRDEIINIMRGDEDERELVDNVPGMIANIRGNRISAHWEFYGPSFNVLENETSIFRCLELARFFIAEKIVDQVVICITSFSGEFEHLYVQKELGAMGMMLEHGIAEGAVVLIVKSKELAIKDKDKIYSVINGVAISSASTDMKKEVDDTLGKVFKQTKMGKSAISAIEIPKSYDSSRRELIQEVCQKKYGKYFDEQLLTLNIEKYLGFGFSLSAAASIVRHALQLYLSRTFTADTNSLHERQRHGDTKHASLVTGYTRGGNFGCVLMTEHQNNGLCSEDKLLTSRMVPLPIPFKSETELIQNIQLMKESISKSSTIKLLYARAWDKYKEYNEGLTTGLARAAVVLCESKESLASELDNLLYRIENDSDFLKKDATLDSFSFDTFIEDVVTEESLTKLCTQFGLTPELVHSLKLGEAFVLCKPIDYLLRLGAKLIFEGISFDYEKFFGNFNFYSLKQPSYICEISTGMPDFPIRIDTEDNRNKLMDIKEQLKKQSEYPVPSMAVPKFKHTRAQQAIVSPNDFYESKYTHNLYFLKNNSESAKQMYIAPEMRMVDDVLSMEHFRGRYGLGKIVAKLDLKSNHPIFESSSKQEAALSKGLLNEAINQIQALYAVNIGYLADGVYKVESSQGLWTYEDKAIKPEESALRYEMHIKSINEYLDDVAIEFEADIYLQDSCICSVICKKFTIKKVTENRR